MVEKQFKAKVNCIILKTNTLMLQSLQALHYKLKHQALGYCYLGCSTYIYFHYSTNGIISTFNDCHCVCIEKEMGKEVKVKLSSFIVHYRWLPGQFQSYHDLEELLAMPDSITKACSIMTQNTHTQTILQIHIKCTWIGDGFAKPALLIAFNMSAKVEHINCH